MYIFCFHIVVLAVELARELEEYGLICSVSKGEHEADSDAESDGVSPQVCNDHYIL